MISGIHFGFRRFGSGGLVRYQSCIIKQQMRDGDLEMELRRKWRMWEKVNKKSEGTGDVIMIRVIFESILCWLALWGKQKDKIIKKDMRKEVLYGRNPLIELRRQMKPFP